MKKGRNSTSALLQKVSSQLKGERVPIKTREEDELTAYLNSLTQKTIQQSKNVNFEDYGENISISSDSYMVSQPSAEQNVPKLTPGGSKFLKKKTSEKPSEKPVPLNSVRSAMTVPLSSPKKTTSASSALNKASALVQRIPERASTSAYKTFVETDTDDTSVSLAKYMHQRPRSGSDHSIGKDGNRFLRKSQDKMQQEDVRPSKPAIVDRTSPIAKKQHTAREKVPEYAHKGSVKYTSSVHLTSEEESLADFRHRLESSDKKTINKSTERMTRANSPFRQSPPPDRARPSSRQRGSHGSPQRTPSPQGVQISLPLYSRSVSQDSDNVDSIVSETMDTGVKLIDMVKLMDIDSLEPADLSPEPQNTKKKTSKKKQSKTVLRDNDTVVNDSPFKAKKKPKTESVFKAKGKSESIFKVKDSATESKGSLFTSSRSDSPFKAKQKTTEKSVFMAKDQVDSSKGTVLKSKKEKKNLAKDKIKSTVHDNLLEKFGIMSVDDLLGDMESDKDDSQDGDISEIVTERSDIFASRKRVDSLSEVGTYLESVKDRHRVSLQTSKISFEHQSSVDLQSSVERRSSVDMSISEKLGLQSSDKSSVIETRSKTISTDDGEDTITNYSEDFEEDVDKSTLHETSDIESEVGPSVPKRHKVVMKSIEIQTEKPAGLSYKWDMTSSGLAIAGPSYGLGFVDPTPIAAHVVSADALEVMTSYNPCMIALHDLLKQQLALTTNFLHVQQRLYDNYTSSIECNHHYTTLEATKEYIEKHRKPRLTFKKALQIITKETDR